MVFSGAALKKGFSFNRNTVNTGGVCGRRVIDPIFADASYNCPAKLVLLGPWLLCVAGDYADWLEGCWDISTDEHANIEVLSVRDLVSYHGKMFPLPNDVWGRNISVCSRYVLACICVGDPNL